MAGPESAASASAAGTLVSMLTLGLPTTAVAAVMLAAFQQYGIQPGPLLFEREPDLVWGLIASLFVGMVLLLALNLPLAPLWAKLLRIPRPYLYAGILFFAAVGAYAVGGEAIDLVILLIIGLIGFGMRRYGLPVLPAVIGVILGPAAEQQLRRALQISDGSVTGLVNTPFSVTVYAVILLLLAWPLVRQLLPRAKTQPQPPLLISRTTSSWTYDRAPQHPGTHGDNGEHQGRDRGRTARAGGPVGRPDPRAVGRAPRCARGGGVREVAAHMSQGFRYPLPRTLLELLKARGSLHRMTDRLAREDAATASADRLAAYLRDNAQHPWKPPVGGLTAALGHDVIHGLDITVALGLDRRVPEDRVRALLGTVDARTLKFFGASLTGVQLRADDLDWSYGTGAPVTGTAQDLLLVAYGRRLPPGRLHGEPSARLCDRLSFCQGQSRTHLPCPLRIQQGVAG